MSVYTGPSVAEIGEQIAEGRKWLADTPTTYQLARYSAIVEVLEQVLREGPTVSEVRRMSEQYAHAERLALGSGDTHGAITPGCKHEALEWLLGRADEPPVDEFD